MSKAQLQAAKAELKSEKSAFGGIRKNTENSDKAVKAKEATSKAKQVILEKRIKNLEKGLKRGG